MPREAKGIIKLSQRDREAMQFWHDNPVQAIKDWFDATPDDWQGDALEGFLGKNAKHDRLAFKSSHGVGKTTFDAWAGWVFLNSYENARVVATAPTLAQLQDILWPEYAKWHARMPEAMQNRWLISGGHIRSTLAPKLWFAVARTSNRPANLQGFHGTDLMIQADEASGVPTDVFEVIEGALSEAGEEGKTSKLVINGNPNFTSGELFDAFNKNRELYHRLTVTGDPMLLGKLGIVHGQDTKENGRVYFSPRVKEKYRNVIETKYGLDSAVYDVRVRGMFPRHDDKSIIPLEWAERARGKEIPKFDPVADPVTIVLDPAREGGNESVVGSFRRGVPVKPLIGRSKTSTNEAADMVTEEIRYWKSQGIDYTTVIVDEPGVGGGPIDELRKRNVRVTAYNGGIVMKQGIDPDDEVRMFANRRARDWWFLRRKLEQNLLPLPDDEVMTAQMASVKFYYRNEKVVAESKRDLTDRLGDEASPDRADVIVMGTAPWRSFSSKNVDLRPADIVVGEDRGAALFAEESM